MPCATPGGRPPHAWLADGRSLYDSFNFEWTLLALGPDAPDTQAFEQIAQTMGLDLKVVRHADPALLALYEAPLALIRPDQILAWRGHQASQAKARKAEKILTEEYPGYSVTRGVLSTEANQLYRGLTPETAEMFARLLGTDENEAFQAYLKQAVANRSAMKRLINRMGIEGFATDVPRVLSAFITSNARLSSGNWYFGEMSKAVEAIPKHKGDVKTDAVKLMQYVQNPVEEAAWLRGFLFFSFLGGSVASAVVNLTQTFTTTLPYLSQFGAGDVAKALPKAMALSGRMMRKGLDAVSDKDLKDALRKADRKSVV